VTNDLIYDIGMNNGDDTAYYLSKGFRVIAIEANPLLAQRVAGRFASEIASGKLQILNIGIAAQDGSADFWVNEVIDEWSSFDRELAARGHPHHSVAIPCKRLKSVLAEHGVPYYLKVDIEGNDFICIADLDRADLPAYVSVEFNHTNLLDHLKKLGYRGFKCIDQATYLAVTYPHSPEFEMSSAALEMVYRALKMEPFKPWAEVEGQTFLYSLARKFRSDGNWVFNHGNSGPFAEGTNGNWLRPRPLVRGWRRECRRRDRYGTPKWFDLHARLTPP
jgi:FkbM family methyltransferase